MSGFHHSIARAIIMFRIHFLEWKPGCTHIISASYAVRGLISMCSGRCMSDSIRTGIIRARLTPVMDGCKGEITSDKYLQGRLHTTAKMRPITRLEQQRASSYIPPQLRFASTINVINARHPHSFTDKDIPKMISEPDWPCWCIPVPGLQPALAYLLHLALDDINLAGFQHAQPWGTNCFHERYAGIV